MRKKDIETWGEEGFTLIHDVMERTQERGHGSIKGSQKEELSRDGEVKSVGIMGKMAT